MTKVLDTAGIEAFGSIIHWIDRSREEQSIPRILVVEFYSYYIQNPL